MPNRATGGFESGAGVAYVLTAAELKRGDEPYRTAVTGRPTNWVADRGSILVEETIFIECL